MASNLLKRKSTSVQASSSYQPIPQQSFASVTYQTEAICGGLTKEQCNSSRKVFKYCMGRAKSAIEQLRILEQVKDQNRFFGRLWDKEISVSSDDFITIGDICGPCQAYYKQKMRTVLGDICGP
jgi:hypothetical protein